MPLHEENDRIQGLTPSEFPELNHLGQPIGPVVPGWKPVSPPTREPMQGRFCRLEVLRPELHAEPLFQAYALDAPGGMWTYLPYGPFATPVDYRAWAEVSCRSSDPIFYAILETETSRPVGVASYLNVNTASGSIEVGHLAFSPLLQRRPAATEAMFLMMDWAFGAGYRRYEWKCNALNAPSRAAAQRLGFSFEGVFRQATVQKGRSRDTAWYAIIDKDWPALKAAFSRWLDPSNFDERGNQRERLSTLTAAPH